MKRYITIIRNEVILLNKEDVIKNKNEAVQMMEDYLEHCLSIDDINIKKANLIAYWQKDYINYLKEEEIFNPIKLKTYERGDVIKANLGFNIGSELGGLHYCVVIDKKNNRKSPVITVIPLSSKKKDTINKNSIFLGNDIYNKLSKKSYSLLQNSKEHMENIKLAEKINKEVQKMKYGSIAIINQIRVISKQRIYDPKTEFDILNGIKLSDENLNLIDNKMKKMFIKK